MFSSLIFGMHWKKSLRLNLILGLAVLLFISMCQRDVETNTSDQVYTSIADVPYNDVGLVLGTSKDGTFGTNLFFKYRMEAAAELYHAGKIKHILVSGDNHKEGYDEPTDMMNYLVMLGVPEKDITRDYAGFRTYDSMIRCHKIFGQAKVTVISQEFHNKRALFIANHRNMEAVAYNARDVRTNFPLREYLARCAAWLDLFVWDRQPRFLGDSEPIQL